MEEFYKNTNNNIPYNPLSVGDVVLVEFTSYNPYYHNLYIDIVKNIDIDSNGYEVCRLQKFNYDIKLLDRNNNLGRMGNQVAYNYYSISTDEDDEKSYYNITRVYDIEGAKKQLLILKKFVGTKSIFNINAYQKYTKFSEKLIEMLELQNKNNINQFYMLRIDSLFADMETFVFFYKEKPSIATIRRQISACCSFKVAEEIYKTEPINYEYDDLHITLQSIDINCFEKDIDDKYDIYTNNTYESDETIKFIKEFKQKYNKELEKLHNKLDTLLSIDELIFDWFTDIEFEDETIEDFIKFIKDNFKFKDE